MRVTNADLGKRQLIALLQAQTGTGEALESVQVEYAAPAQELLNEVIYGGRMAGANDGSVDPPRLETAEFDLIIAVARPELELDTNDQRAIALFQVVEDTLAANPQPFGSGTWWVQVGYELASSRTADSPRSTLTATVQMQSFLGVANA